MNDPQSPISAQSEPIKVLIADADPLFARILRSKLEKWGYRAEIEPSGAAALALFRVDDYRIVILDFDLPGLDGLELARRVRALERPRYTYLLFYSARRDKDAMLAALDAGADDFMLKPFNAVEVSLRLKTAQRLLELDDELYSGSGLDRMSGVISRNAFRQFFGVTLAQARRNKTQGALMFIRVTNLVDIQRQHGFHAAQRLALSLAPGMQALRRNSDLLAKTGDDEFCLMLQDTFWDKCRPVADRVIALASEIIVMIDEIELAPQIEISVLNFPCENLNVDQHMERTRREFLPKPIPAAVPSPQSGFGSI